MLALQPPPGFRIIFPATACVFFVLFQSHQFRGHFHHNQLSVVTGGANSLVRVDSRKRKIKHEKNHEKDLCKASRLPWDPFRCQTVVSDCAAHRVWSESCACAARHCGTWLLCHRGVAALALRQEHLEEALNFLKADGSGSKKRKREEEARTVIQLWKTSHQAKSFQKLKWVQLKIVH